MERDSIDLSTMNIFSLFKRFFIPTLLGMLSIAAVSTADGIFVGHAVGSNGIAAVNLCIPPLMFFTGVGLMIGVGCSVVASIHLAHGKVKVARLNVTQALLFTTVIALTMSFLMLISPKTTAYILGSSDTLLPYVTDYLIWFIPGILFQMWISIALFVIRLDGAPRLAMLCSLIAAIVNIVLDWLFLFPFGWGVMGAAFASTISMFMGGMIAIVYLLFYARTIRLCAIKWSRKSMLLSMRNIGYQCRIGSSSLLGESTMAVLMYMGNIIFMHYLGDDGVGAFGIACYYTPFVFMVGNAIAQSSQPIISYNYGLGHRDRVRSAQRIALYTAIFFGTTVTLIFTFYPSILVELFIKLNSRTAQIAVEGFPYFAIGFIFFIFNLVAIGYFQSVERLRPATTFSFLRGLLFLVPCFIFLPQIAGINGIWLAMPLSETLTAISIITFYFYCRKHKRTIYQFIL